MKIKQALKDLQVRTGYRAPLLEHISELSTTQHLIGSGFTRKAPVTLKMRNEVEVFDSIEDFILFAEAMGDIGRSLRKRL